MPHVELMNAPPEKCTLRNLREGDLFKKTSAGNAVYMVIDVNTTYHVLELDSGQAVEGDYTLEVYPLAEGQQVLLTQ